MKQIRHWNTVVRLWRTVQRRLGIEAAEIIILRPTAFGMTYAFGQADCQRNAVTCHWRGALDCEVLNTLAHEALHILFPNKPHWWIECAAHQFFPWRDYAVGETVMPGKYSKRYWHEACEVGTQKQLRRRIARAIKARFGQVVAT